MSSFRPLCAWLGLLMLAAPLLVSAQGSAGLAPPGDDIQWMLALSALRDEDAYEQALASFHLGIRERTWFSVTAGQSRAPSTEPDVRAGLAAIGIEHDFGSIGLGLSVEDWGDANNLESRDWRGEIFFGDDRYRVALLRETRAIDIYYSGGGILIPTDLRRASIDADALGVNWRVRAAPRWRLYGTWMDYDYPRRIALVPRIDRLDFLSTSAVTLAYGFVDRYGTIGVEHTLGQKLIEFDWSQDRATIGGGRVESFAASVLWPVARRMDLEFRLGSSRADGFGSRLYGGLTLLIYGG
jgi:hypothetical protein